jgi:flagellar assembly protein FliH
MRDIRLFRARVGEAVETAVEIVIGDIAAEVLARELKLAPANVERIVDRALQRYFSEEPLRVRVHPADAAAIECSVPVVADGELAPGDAVLELRDGYVDARFGVRLASVLRGTMS